MVYYKEGLKAEEGKSDLKTLFGEQILEALLGSTTTTETNSIVYGQVRGYS